ncbi:MAG TPA: transcription-repair coupling factor [Anaerolineaceae bacterium]|nr:MAG: Transcription-repair coupling factor [Anaerolineae bacterium 49_20]HAE86247.1 transcription-repair coupling factor [Anaerolineaceae bacterium]
MAKLVDHPVLNYVRSLPAYQQLLEQLKKGGFKDQERFGLGLPRASRLAILAALHVDLHVPVVLLTNRADRALELYDELGFWLPEGNNLYFPEPNPLFYENLPWSESARQERLLVLTELAKYLMPDAEPSDTPPVIVAPIRAVMTRTVPRRDFLRASQRIILGDHRDLQELVGSWVGLGYQYSNIVVKPGQFSRRGGILDIWSPAEEMPVRTEFFGEEIDTLKHFDPSTQRTVSAVKQTVIFPASEALPMAAEKKGLLLDSLTEFDIPLLYDFPSSLMDYLPSQTLILLDGEEFITAATNDIEEEAEARLQSLVEQKALPEDFPLPYITWSEIEDSFTHHQVLELGHTNAFGLRPLAAAFDPGPRFAGRLKEFQAHLQEIERKAEPWIVVSRQAARLRQLWQENHPQVSADQAEVFFVEGFLSGGWELKLANGQIHHLLTDSEIFGWGRPQVRRRPALVSEAPELVFADLKPGDWVVHVDYGIGQFIGLHRTNIKGSQREYLTIQYKDNDVLYVPIHQADRLTRYIGPDDQTPAISRLGGMEWNQTKRKVSQAVQAVAKDLLELYAKRQVAKGFKFSQDKDWQRELEASFPYIETPDQLEAIQEVKADMESERPMDRLLTGDVGYGKTEVALRAAFKAVLDGKQVAVLVPTTVLAQQHYDTFRQRLATFPVNVEMLSRFRSPKEQNEILKKLANKQVDIVIGTHRLISSDVKFNDLGLVIIDEEQRFGVSHKEHLKKLRNTVDVLTLTATPIPRTLYMALTGVRDISNINSAPEERLPVITHIGVYDPKLVREAITREMDRGGQVFYVHNRVQSIPAVYNHLSNLVPEASIAIAHGQMPEDELAEVMHAFTDGRVDVLLCTSIIESGLDIPNANTLIVDRADMFGLAQLYQLRGRVGRGAQQAFAYLFRSAKHQPTPEGQERLEVLAENVQLGAGYTIAMRDLEMRGAGDLLGTRQSGYIAAVGFQLYTRLLSQAVRALRAEAGLPPETGAESGLPWLDDPSLSINVELPLASEIPSSYIPDQDLRLSLYRRIASIRSEEELVSTEIEFADRFGEPPQAVRNLFYQMKVKLLAGKAGLEAINMLRNQIVLSYPELPQGMRQRRLREIDPVARAGKNAYWINFANLADEDWQEVLVRVLHKLANEAQ